MGVVAARSIMQPSPCKLHVRTTPHTARAASLPPHAQGISSLIYAGERVATDLAEVATVGKMLVSKYR